MDRINNKLPGDPTALVLGIVSLFILLLGCCCGLFAIVSLTLGIIGLVMANKALSEFANEPDNYAVESYKNMNTAKIIGIIGIALSALVMFAQVAIIAVTGERFSEEFWKEFKRGQGIDNHWDWDSNSAIEQDSVFIDTLENTIILKKQGDSIIIDTTGTQP